MRRGTASTHVRCAKRYGRRSRSTPCSEGADEPQIGAGLAVAITTLSCTRRTTINGWALYGLSTALKAQGKAAQSAQVARQLATAWKHADGVLTASAF